MFFSVLFLLPLVNGGSIYSEDTQEGDLSSTHHQRLEQPGKRVCSTQPCSRGGDTEAICKYLREASYTCICSSGYLFGTDTCIAEAVAATDKCEDPEIAAKCAAVNAICVRKLNLDGYSCECRFPNVFVSKLNGTSSCFIDPGLTPYKGSIHLESVWTRNLSLNNTIEYLELYTKVEKLLKLLFLQQHPVVNSFIPTPRNFVKAEFYLNVNNTINIEKYLKDILHRFLRQSQDDKKIQYILSLDVIPDLIFDLETLEVSKKGLNCEDINFCSAGLDRFATCSSSDKGPDCACSPGYAVHNHVCQDEDECIKNRCKDGGDLKAVCSNFHGYFQCYCSKGYVSSVAGCTAYSKEFNPCSSEKAKQECQTIGAVCTRALNNNGFECECKFPEFVMSDGMCKPISSSRKKIYHIVLPLSKNITWSPALANKTSLEYLMMKAEAEKFLNTVFNGTVPVVTGFNRKQNATFTRRLAERIEPLPPFQSTVARSRLTRNDQVVLQNYVTEILKGITIVEQTPKVYRVELPIGPNKTWSEDLADPGSLEHLQMRAEAQKFLATIFKDTEIVVEGFKQNETPDNSDSDVSLLTIAKGDRNKDIPKRIRRQLAERTLHEKEVWIPGVSFSVLANGVKFT